MMSVHSSKRLTKTSPFPYFWSGSVRKATMEMLGVVWCSYCKLSPQATQVWAKYLLRWLLFSAFVLGHLLNLIWVFLSCWVYLWEICLFLIFGVLKCCRALRCGFCESQGHVFGAPVSYLSLNRSSSPPHSGIFYLQVFLLLHLGNIFKWHHFP